MDHDPGEAYDVTPIPLGQLMASYGWWQCRCNGVPQWIGPKERMEKLATDPDERAKERRSKMHHDREPT